MEVEEHNEQDVQLEQPNVVNNSNDVIVDNNPPDNVEETGVVDVQMENSEESGDGADTNEDADFDQSCPICMDLWTSSGEHRLCCLRCGHLFGHSCILRWLQTSCTSGNRRCPQCNKKAAVKDIRMLYAKKLTSIDTIELDKLKAELSIATASKHHLEMELSRYNIRQKLYEQQVSSLKNRITELETQQAEVNVNLNHSTSRCISKKFHLERSIDICKSGGCRVLEYSPWYRFLVVSEQSNNPLFPGYGIKKIDSDKFQPLQSIRLHYRPIRDLAFHSSQHKILLSVGFDKCAKLTDIENNVIMQNYEAEFQLWSCCWSGDNPNTFLTGANNGSIIQFDIRQTSGPICTLDSSGDRSPVVSLAKVPPHSLNGIGRGGFIACRLNSCYAYELKDTKYVPKQLFLEGPFVSVCYDEKNAHALISTRPNVRHPHARHTVCTIEKSTEDTVVCNIIHTFQAGNSQQLLSRPCYVDVESDTLVAAHQESTSSIPLWSIATGKQLHTIPVSDPVVDMCSFEANNTLLLATLSMKKLRLYNYG